jgi:hypothetical protein
MKSSIILDIEPGSNLPKLLPEAPDGATVRLKPGTYSGNLFIDKSLTLLGVESSSKILIDSMGLGTVIEIKGSGLEVVLKNLVIKNGVARMGAGIAINGNNHIEVRNCSIQDNFATYDGGGICANAGQLFIIQTQISNNSGKQGGGICLDYTAQATLQDSVIVQNLGKRGGGIRVKDGARVMFKHCTLADNQLDQGGYGEAIYVSGTMSRQPVLNIIESIISSQSQEACLFNAATYPGHVNISHSLLQPQIEKAKYFEDSGGNVYGHPTFLQRTPTQYPLKPDFASTEWESFVIPNDSEAEKAPMPSEFHLSRYEYFLLLNMLGIHEILGLEFEKEDFGADPDKTEKALKHALQSLRQAGFINTNSQGKMVPVPYLSELISVCASPEQSVIAIYIDVEKDRHVHFYHISSDLAVEDIVAEDGSHTLSKAPLNSLAERIIAQFNLDEQPAVTASQCKLSRTNLEKARQAATSGEVDAVIEQLQAAEVEQHTANSLAYALVYPISYSALRIANYAIETVQSNLDILELGEGLWVLHSSSEGDAQVKCMPASAAEIKKLIVDNVPHG